MRDLILVGGGEHARVIADAVAAARSHRVLGFVDPNPYAVAESSGLRYLGPDEALREHAAVDLILGFGSLGPGDRRATVAERLAAAGFRFATVVHPAAIISPGAVIEAGAFIGAGAIVQTGAVVGAHALVNTGVILEHDVQLAPHVQLATRVTLGGGVLVGRAAFIGMGATVRDHRRIGARAVIGMGAVVVADVPPEARVAGVPARTMLAPAEAAAP